MKRKQFIIKMILLLFTSVVAWYGGHLLPIVGAPLFALFLGSMLAPFVTQQDSTRLFQKSAKHLLFFAILLLGFSMDFHQVVRTSTNLLFFILGSVLLSLTAAWIFTRLLKLQGDTAILVGIGTSICGGSAILASASVIKANEDDIAQAMSTIFLFNFLAAILFPIFGNILQLTPEQFGTWAGTAINDTSSVLAATYSFSDASVDQGIMVKLTRTLMIIPITLALALRLKQQQNPKTGFQVKIPWLVVAFLAAALFRTTQNTIDPNVWDYTKTASQGFMIMALVSIGFRTHLLEIFRKGKRAILLGLLTWIVLSLVTLGNLL